MDIYLEIAEAIKKDIGEILGNALAGYKDDYKYKPQSSAGFIRWGLVQEDINRAIDYNLGCCEDNELK